MTTIINLKSERERRVARAEENTPHLSGSARCLGCKHEWVAVAPVGTSWLECPSCRLGKGRYVSTFMEDDSHWHCDCGNELFACSQRYGWYCPMCGACQKGWEDWA